MKYYIPFCVSLFLVVVCTSANPISISDCRVPNFSILQSEILRLNSDDRLMGIIPAGWAQVQCPSETSLELSPCPDGVAPTVDDDANEVAVCPWEYRNNCDESRYPAAMGEAHCLCNDGCLSSDNQASPALGRCVPLYHNITVLKTDGQCVGGYFVYKPVEEKIAVGCTCARPRHVPVGDPKPED